MSPLILIHDLESPLQPATTIVHRQDYQQMKTAFISLIDTRPNTICRGNGSTHEINPFWSASLTVSYRRLTRRQNMPRKVADILVLWERSETRNWLFTQELKCADMGSGSVRWKDEMGCHFARRWHTLISLSHGHLESGGKVDTFLGEAGQA
ncbi:hypothetical protein EV421DRAFT_1910423 [Armillaria borealis]|uniref:Uncharacterized protein n=1 Tax=Armillaria borealis TaxID=47425 RepID=A0AA39J018_9AGAR|nr:hypothetical protein EV421DRAFT_1910423 [Armillaria borealis]